jgi:malonyl-CoA/methylmalonyl-CoA synthetase
MSTSQPLLASVTDPLDWLRVRLKSAPDSACVYTETGACLSYAEIDRRAGVMAQALKSLGVAATERVLVQVDKSVDALSVYLGCLKLNAVFVPVNTANTPAELAYFANDAKPRCAIIRPNDAHAARALGAIDGLTQVLTLGQDQGSLVEQATRMAPLADAGAYAASSVAALIYTSGTTGRSKGAMLTRGNIASNGAALAAAWAFSERDVLLHVLPLFHVHGLFAALSTTLAAGASLRLESQFNLKRTLELLPQSTVFMGVPTHYTRLLQEPQLTATLTRAMRLFVSGSAPLLADTHAAFYARTGHTILERYGMTETLMNTSNPYEGERRAGTVGIALPGVSVRIMADTGVIEPPTAQGLSVTPQAVEADIGEIQIKGPNVCAGYWQDADKTRSSLTTDGWFRSGDLGSWTAAGYLQIVGRAKDLIISGGYNVYPKEIEAVLDALTGVAESAVFGVSHPDFGEGVTAALVAKPGHVLDEASVLGAVSQQLAKYKCPKRVFILAELPRNTMGKVQKNLLRQQYAEIYRQA